MLKNNLKIAWRHLLKDKYISAINLTGLIVGMTAVLFIWQYVAFERSYDNFHENSDRIVRIRTDRIDNGVPFMQFAAGAACAGPVIANNFAEVENYVKLYGSSDALYTNEKNITFQPEQVYYAMPSLFDIFSFSLIKGDEKTALAEPFQACISETTARKMFGDEDPIGKTITRNNQNVYQVTGIFPDSKKNSHLKFDILLSYITFSDVFNDEGGTETAAYWDGFYAYILLKPNTDVAALAIFVSCLGLFALVAFVAERKRKEIGIRKVLGATVSGIVGLLSKDFIKLVILALVISTPIAWVSMNNWLENFENRIEIPWSIFAIAGMLAIVIALVTVSFHSIKAALANPVKSLRNE